MKIYFKIKNFKKNSSKFIKPIGKIRKENMVKFCYVKINMIDKSMQ